MIKNFLITVFILILLGLSVFVGLRTHHSKEKSFYYNDTQRRYRLHLPKGYVEDQEYPMVVAFHGLSFGARVLELNTGLSRLADKEGFIVVYPYGTRPNMFTFYSWNSEFCCAYAHKENIDDVGFISSLIDYLRTEYKVERNKVFLTGHSNGGMLASYVSLKHPDKVRALAPVSSAIGGKILDDDEYRVFEKSNQPVPVLLINGKDDLVVPFGGGERGGFDIFSFSSVYDAVNLWLENNNCSKHPSEISNQDKFTKETYTDCQDGAEVVLFAYKGAHTWPGGAKDFLKNISGQSVSATQIIWNFFKTH